MARRPTRLLALALAALLALAAAPAADAKKRRGCKKRACRGLVAKSSVARGLPAGPIANPGREALAATLNPEPTRAIFFVAKGDGGHVFAETLAEHNANVQRWYAIRRSRGEM